MTRPRAPGSKGPPPFGGLKLAGGTACVGGKESEWELALQPGAGSVVEKGCPRWGVGMPASHPEGGCTRGTRRKTSWAPVTENMLSSNPESIQQTCEIWVL